MAVMFTLEINISSNLTGFWKYFGIVFRKNYLKIQDGVIEKQNVN